MTTTRLSDYALRGRRALSILGRGPTDEQIRKYVEGFNKALEEIVGDKKEKEGK